jgi:hypothetical protein
LEFQRYAYTEKRKLEVYAIRLYGARNVRNDIIYKWIQNIHRISSKFIHGSLEDFEDEENVGDVALAGKLRSICHLHGIFFNRTKKVVHRRKITNFDKNQAKNREGKPNL